MSEEYCNLGGRLIVALDVESPERARALVERLGDAVSFYKVGMELVFSGGLPLVAELTRAGKRVFLDMKLLDIGNTVEKATAAVARTGATFLTVHAYPQAMAAAARGRGEAALGLLAVTVMTSLDDDDLRDAGYGDGIAALVDRRARPARAAGIDGLICSPHEVSRLREAHGDAFRLVVPGIRPAFAEAGDQKRLATPAAAIRDGADFLVVGRPVTAAPDPLGAVLRIVDEIAASAR